MKRTAIFFKIITENCIQCPCLQFEQKIFWSHHQNIFWWRYHKNILTARKLKKLKIEIFSSYHQADTVLLTTLQAEPPSCHLDKYQKLDIIFTKFLGNLVFEFFISKIWNGIVNPVVLTPADLFSFLRYRHPSKM